jgi:stalled ribosome rescue protein Dom34
MTTPKNKKQYGVWMDTQAARIAGRQDIDSGDFVMLGIVSNDESNQLSDGSSNKYFKEIANKMPNIDEIHITGTGQVQEQFMKFLADTPQYKNAVTTESTSNKMGDEQLLALLTKHFN